MTVAVVAPCRNEGRTVTGLLDAIAAQSARVDEVIVVDDRSTDGTVAAIEAWATAHPDRRVRIVRGEGRGAGAAMNAGISAAGADVIVRLDGHCRPAPDYIALCLAALAHPRAGVSGGVWTIEAGATSLTARAIASVLSHPLGSGGAEYRRPPAMHDRQGPRAVDTVPFGTFRRDLWTRVGGFDETLLRNQDYDFNHRVRLAGHDVVLDPAIVSTYKARPTLGALWRQYFEYGFWKVVMLRKFPGSMRVRQLLPLLLLPLLIAAGLAAAISRSAIPLWIPAAYLLMNAGGAIQAAARAGDARLIPAGAAALTVLQLAWSTGASVSVLGLPHRSRGIIRI